MYPEVGSRLDDECSVTKFLPVDYNYVKLWDGRPFSQKIRGNLMKLAKPLMSPKGAGLFFYLTPYLGEDGLTIFRIFGGMDLIRSRGSQIWAISGHISSYGLV